MHWCGFQQTTETSSPKFLRSTRRTKAAPVSLPESPRGGGVCLGEKLPPSPVISCISADEDRVRHMHIVGASGTGESTLLLRLIGEDIKRGDRDSVSTLRHRWRGEGITVLAFLDSDRGKHAGGDATVSGGQAVQETIPAECSGSAHPQLLLGVASMAEMLAEARKYRMELTLAHQTLTQLSRDSDMLNAVPGTSRVHPGVGMQHRARKWSANCSVTRKKRWMRFHLPHLPNWCLHPILRRKPPVQTDPADPDSTATVDAAFTGSPQAKPTKAAIVWASLKAYLKAYLKSGEEK